MAIIFFEDALVDGASAAGLFIPGTNLLGVTVGEFADTESLAKKRGKLCNGLTRKICDYIIAQSNLLDISKNYSYRLAVGV